MLKKTDGMRQPATLLLPSALVVVFVGIIIGTSGPVARSSAQSDPRNPNRPETIDDLFARVAEKIPAFGGMFLGNDGILYVYLTDRSPGAIAAVRQSLISILGAQNLPEHREMRALPGLYGFLELKEWRERMSDVLSLPGVVLVDIDERINRLTVGIDSPQIRDKVEEAVALLGVPTEAVEIAETGPVREFHSLSDRHRLIGGLQILFTGGESGFCTLTAVNLDWYGYREGAFLTNSHCSAIQGKVDGTVFYQPDDSQQNRGIRIGYEETDPPFFRGRNKINGFKCPAGRRCRLSDLLIGRLDPGIDAVSRQIARPPGEGSTSWNGRSFYWIRRHGWPNQYIGQPAMKVGYRTGRTSGKVIRSCVDVNRPPDQTLLCQWEGDFAADHGDSGSPVFAINQSDPPPKTVSWYGLLWGGDSTGVYFSVWLESAGDFGWY